MNSKYFSYIKSFYSELNDSSLNLISDKLLSPFQLELPVKLLEQAQSLVQTLYAMREDTRYQSFVESKSPPSAQWDPGNKSICMSYDFHVSSEGDLKLIEVNTNAAFLLMGYFLYQSNGLPLPVPDFSLDELHLNFLEEFYLNLNRPSHSKNQKYDKLDHSQLKSLKPLTIAIVDENPTTQKLYFEFLLYQQLLRSFGHKVFILDPLELVLNNDNCLVSKNEPHIKIDFIYNRLTDFYLDQPAMESIKLAYLNKSVTLSPNPHEYSLLADKKRLIEWSLLNGNKEDLSSEQSSQYSELIKHKSNLLNTILLTEESKSFIWANKKKFFIKPLTSFGSKGSYRGEGVSKSLFEQLIGKNFLAQEFCPAPEMVFTQTNIEPTKLKYDLRFYAYKDRIQLVIARLYQGQLTNLKTENGGFAPVIFK